MGRTLTSPGGKSQWQVTATATLHESMIDDTTMATAPALDRHDMPWHEVATANLVGRYLFRRAHVSAV